MFSKQDLQMLVDLETGEKVLSLYLNTNLGEHPIGSHELRLRALLDEVDLPADEKAVQAYFHQDYAWKKSRGAVVFSSRGGDVFHAYPLSVNLQDRVKVGQYPYLAPLSNLWDAYSGNGVVTVDQQGANLYVFQMGELLDQAVYRGEEIQRQKHGGGSQTTGTWRGGEGAGEHFDQQTDRNLREAAALTDEFFTKHEVRRVFLGGTEKNLSAFEKHLQTTWRSLISGTFSMDKDMEVSRIQEQVLSLVQRETEKTKRALAQTVITEAAKGRSGLLRVDDILGAVREGRVQTLLIEDGYQQAGYQCQGCEYLTVQELEACPFCGEEFREIDDVGALVVRSVLNAGGRVEVYPGDDHELADRGGMGALLRY